MTRDSEQQQSERPWQPIGAHYVPTRSAWMVLFCRYGPDGYQLSQRIYKDDEIETMLSSERGGVADA